MKFDGQNKIESTVGWSKNGLFPIFYEDIFFARTLHYSELNMSIIKSDHHAPVLQSNT
jgi:hypothetical protein